MGRYCAYTDVVARFRTATRIESYQTAIESYYIFYAENELDQRLGQHFTVPFSSNNITAKDLAIDMSYAIAIRYDDPKKYDAIWGRVDSIIGDLINGDAVMITDSGDSLTSAGTNAAWSNTMNYHSAFGMGEFIDFQVDSSQLYNEEQARL